MHLPAIFALMDSADDALDKDTYDQFAAANWEPNGDAEFTVYVSTIRKCFNVFEALDKLRRMPVRDSAADLLEALREAERALTEQHERSLPAGSANSVLDRIRTVIAKAESDS